MAVLEQVGTVDGQVNEGIKGGLVILTCQLREDNGVLAGRQLLVPVCSTHFQPPACEIPRHTLWQSTSLA